MKEAVSGEFGQRLKEVRKKLNNMTQKDFGAKIEMSGSYLSEIESGVIKPGFDFFYRIIREFKISPVYLLHGEPPVFIDEKKPEEECRNKYEEIDKKMKELLFYMEHSDPVRYAVLEFFSRYYLQHRDIIKDELKEKGIDPGSGKF